MKTKNRNQAALPIVLNRLKAKPFALTLLIVAGFFTTSPKASAQKMQDFFYSKGVKDLCQAAHVSNDYESGTYDVHDDYVDVTFISKDHVFNRDIHTSVRLIRGVGGFYFNDLIAPDDGDVVKPFNAFGLTAALMLTLTESIDKESYNKLEQAITDQFHTDVKQWNGKMWALFAINLDYFEYAVKN
ncbi:hypothetical protein [Mucilaginibacter paludis]|uniref:Uncharacterized protein n=1 Tax=Mucilaginibacter paludis DSM 18603 TaxID=714943 RepID=H1Y3L9_9SPHI|nr:hypothetical protein [Mucilaginibacter paludis]EHQ29787.1 hypothetical protein Mucpa_5719 [Mucilaginibacter paludis DSM 18603]